MPDEDGFYTLDDMKLTKQQMLEYFGLIPTSGVPHLKWPINQKGRLWYNKYTVLYHFHTHSCFILTRLNGL
jgi:hypothetical protein